MDRLPGTRPQSTEHASTRDIFDGAVFDRDPRVLYNGCRDLFLHAMAGQAAPVSVAHRFFALLERKGLLLRVYDQNIDCLTVASVGTPERVR